MKCFIGIVKIFRTVELVYLITFTDSVDEGILKIRVVDRTKTCYKAIKYTIL